MDQNEARSTQDATLRNDIPQNKCKPKRKRMKQRSAGWDHFVKYTDKDGSTRARCKYCPDKSFACDSISNGTSNLLRHYKSCTMNPENAMTQTVLKLQSNIINGEGTLSCWRYDQDAIRTSLAHMLIIDELSFRFVEKEGFRAKLVEVWARVAIWWGVDRPNVASVASLLEWSDSLRFKSSQKKVFDAVIVTTLWVLWKFRNNTLFGNNSPKKSNIFDEIVDRAYFWISNRCKKKIGWGYDGHKSVCRFNELSSKEIYKR
ncbi:hypothetical protein LXL04_037840 [Taraxacum kok-saghyz]